MIAQQISLMDNDLKAVNTDREDETAIATALRYLVKNSGMEAKKIADDCKISLNTLYAMMHRNATKANLATLKKLADYFHVDLEIFCGLEAYQKTRISERETELLTMYQILTDDAKARVDAYIKDVAGNPNNRL